MKQKLRLSQVVFFLFCTIFYAQNFEVGALSKEKFIQLYQTDLDNLAQLEIQKTIPLLEQSFTISNAQKKQLSELVLSHCKIRIYNYHYNKSNPLIAVKQLALDKARANLEYFELLSSFNTSEVIEIKSGLQSLTELVQTSKKAFISTSKINGITHLFLKNQLALTSLEYYKVDEKSIYIENENYSKSAVNSVFIVDISSLLTQDEFKIVFKDFFSYEIVNAQQSAWKQLSLKYNISKKQNSKVKTISNHYTQEKVLLRHYLSKLENSSQRQRLLNQLYLKEHEALQKALLGLEIITIEQPLYLDKRIPFFIERAKKAGVPKDKINGLIKALNERVTEDLEYDANFTEWKTEHLVYYHDEENGPYASTQRLKRKIASLVTSEQFDKMFFPQIEPKIIRIATKRLENLVRKNEALGTKDLTEIKKMLLNHARKEEMTFSYYSYDLRYGTQKSKTLQYKHERKLKEQVNQLLNK